MNKITKKKLLAIAALVLIISLFFPFIRTFLKGWMIGEILLFQRVLMHFQGGFPHLGTVHVLLLYGFSIYGFTIFSIKFLKLDLVETVKSIPSHTQTMLFDFKQNWRTYGLCAVWCLIITFTSTELFLRHMGWDDTYGEKNWCGDYQSPFNSSGEDGWFHTQSPNDSNICVKKEFTQTTYTNSLGLCDKEWSLKPKKKRRIFTIGDSFTQGIGASQDSSYPKVLQNLLGDSVEVCNAGVSGSDPFFGYILLREKLLKYHPTDVLITINTSDNGDVISRGGFERFHSDGTLHFRKGPWWEPVYAQSYVFRYLKKENGFYHFFMNQKEYDVAYSVASRQLRDCIDSLSILCSQHNIKLHVVFHPMKDELFAQKFKNQSLLRYCEDKNISTINVMDHMLTQLDSLAIENLYWRYDGHYKDHGYRMMAEAIAKKIK